MIVHTGTTGLGAGMPGGGRLKLEPSRPIHLDAVAADFPDLQIVMAHPAWPWQDEQLAVALHKPNTWIDLSGWSPRRFAPDLVRNIKGPLQDRVLFGTDYPFLTHEQWFGAWETLDIPDDVTEKVLLRNAAAPARRPSDGGLQLGELLPARRRAAPRARPCASPRTRRRRARVRDGDGVGIVGQAVEGDPRRAAAVRVVPRDGDRLVEPVDAQHEHPQRVAPLPLQPRLRVVVGPDRLRVERVEVLGLGDRRDVDDVGPARRS